MIITGYGSDRYVGLGYLDSVWPKPPDSRDSTFGDIPGEATRKALLMGRLDELEKKTTQIKTKLSEATKKTLVLPKPSLPSGPLPLPSDALPPTTEKTPSSPGLAMLSVIALVGLVLLYK